MIHIKFDFFGEGDIYNGYTDYSTWNGFDNVWVTKDVLDKLMKVAKADKETFNPDDWPDAPDEYGLYSLANGFSTSIRGFTHRNTFINNPFTEESGRFIVDPTKHYKKTSSELAKIFSKNWREMRKWV